MSEVTPEEIGAELHGRKCLAARQLRTGEEDASRSYAHAEAKRQSMTLTRKLAMVRRSAYAVGDRP